MRLYPVSNHIQAIDPPRSKGDPVSMLTKQDRCRFSDP
jgi:hypothetical protein